jgi:hypothetical protein
VQDAFDDVRRKQQQPGDLRCPRPSEMAQPSHFSPVLEFALADLSIKFDRQRQKATESRYASGSGGLAFQGMYCQTLPTLPTAFVAEIPQSRARLAQSIRRFMTVFDCS